MCSTLTMCSYSNLFNGRKCILPGELAQALQHGSREIEQKLEVEQLCEKMTLCDNLMLLDCRSFLAYNFKHITGALNVNCSGIGRKRLQQGKASLVDLISSEYGKELLKSGKWAKAVVYDESTVELEQTPSSHPVKLVMMSLLSQGKEAFLLKGGLKEFSQCYQNLLATRSPETPLAGPTHVVSNTIERINKLAKYQNDIEKNQPNPGCPLNVRATEILPRVYLGNAKDANDKELLERNNILYILNLTCNCPNYFDDNSNFHYKQIRIEDSCREDIKTIINEAIEFIDLAKTNNASVLIHCQGGVSRSPTITIAYLMHANKITLKEAYDFVKTKRPCIAPNLNFMGQLLEYEQMTDSKTTKQIEPAEENIFLPKFSFCCSNK